MKETYTLYGAIVKSDCIIENGAVTVEDGRIIYAGPRSEAPLLGDNGGLDGRLSASGVY